MKLAIISRVPALFVALACDPKPNPSLVEQAASAACTSRPTTTATDIPSSNERIGEAFAFGAFPGRFVADVSKGSYLFEGYWCHTIGGLDGDWGPLPQGEWVENDGQVHVYMVTKGIEDVIYYGTDESPPGVPGEPRFESIRHDVSEHCPELADVWMPDIPAGHGRPSGLVCMRHSETIAEVMFVRVP